MSIFSQFEAQKTSLEALPQPRGKLRSHVNLAPTVWFSAGGQAEVLFKPEDEEDLAIFLKNLDPSIPRIAIGLGSNLLVRDGGIPGVVIRLGQPFTKIELSDTNSNEISVGCAALDKNIARVAQKNQIGGFTFMHGIPGTIGGAIRMNAGAHGCELAQRLVSMIAWDDEGEMHQLRVQDVQYSYRHLYLAENMIFTRCILKGIEASAQEIDEQMRAVSAHRESAQPIKARTGGSTFKNPTNHSAWKLIDAAGCRGLSVGSAQVSELHCNFLINNGGASATEIEILGELVRKRVFEHCGIRLEWEIKRIGQLTTEGIDEMQRYDIDISQITM